MNSSSPQRRKQIWRPVSFLPMMGQLIDEARTDAHTMMASLEKVRHFPELMDDAIISRMTKNYTEQLELLDCQEKQLQRWQKETLDLKELQEIRQRLEQVAELRVQTNELLRLTSKFAPRTIDRIPAKSDEGIGLEFLMGCLKNLPEDDPPSLRNRK
jgi:hypothetical protein